MRVLVACEFSGVVREAFRKKGHDAWSCDIVETEAPGKHIKGDVLDILDDGWDMMIAHPPCTYITVTANKWLKDQPARKSGVLVGRERREARADAIRFFMRLANCGINKICLENPVGAISTAWRKPDQIIQPYFFGHKESKKTCLWLKNLPMLEHTDIVEQEPRVMLKKGGSMPAWYVSMPHSKERVKMRNRTFQGIADAMAEQWG